MFVYINTEARVYHQLKSTCVHRLVISSSDDVDDNAANNSPFDPTPASIVVVISAKISYAT